MDKAAVAGTTPWSNEFLLNPNFISDDSLFRPMVRKGLSDPKVRDHLPSEYLDIEFNVSQIGEMGLSAKYSKSTVL